MAVLTVTRSTTLFNDANGNGKADPGDKLLTHILFTPLPATILHAVTVADQANGSTVVAGSVLVTESDVFSIVGNTPISFTAAQVLANDFNGDGPNQGNTGLTVTAATESDGHGSVALGAGGTVTFTPATGYVGDATYTYTVTDALGTIGTASVTVHITSDIWYVDSNATLAGADGSFLHPFLHTTDATAVDHANDTIFVYNHGGNYAGNVVLENGEKLIGDGVTFVANGITVSSGASGNATLTAASGTIVTLATNNDVEGVTLTGTSTAAGMTGSNFGNLIVAHTSIDTATGQILSLVNGTIDDTVGGVSFTALSSSGTAAGTAAIVLSNVDNNGPHTGTFTAGAVTIAGAAGHGIDIDGGSSANVHFNGTTSIAGAAGDAVHIDGASTAGDGAVTFGTLTVTTPTGNGVSIVNDTGAVSVTGGSIGNTSGAGSDGLHVVGGSADITVGASITKTSSGNPVDISGHTSGTIALSGVISASSAANGVTLDTNTGTTINISGSLLLNTSSANTTAFSAIGGGTLSVTGAGSIVNSGSATAVNIANTVIGSAGVKFQAVSSVGGTATGIILDHAGTGGFTVTGIGTSAGSGGTIANKTDSGTSSTGTIVGTGVYVSNTSNVSLSNVNLHDFGDFAIHGTTVGSFTLKGSTINGTNGNNATGSGEGSVYFDDLTGTSLFQNSLVSGALVSNIQIKNSSGPSTLTFDNVSVGANSAANGNDGLSIETLNNATINVTVQNSTFTASRGDLFQFVNNGTGNDTLTFTGNHLSNSMGSSIATGGGGVTLDSGATSTDTFTIQNNTFRDSVGHAVLVVKPTGTGILNLDFSNNTVGVAGIANSGSLEGSDIKVQTVGGGTLKANIANNQFYQYNNNGIELEAGGGASAQSGNFIAKVIGNTVSNPGNNPSADIPKNAFQLNLGTVPGDTFQGYLTLGGAGGFANNFDAGGKDSVSSPTIGDLDVRLRERQATTVHLYALTAGGTQTGYSGANNDNTAVQNFVVANNPSTTSGQTLTVLASNTVATGGGFVGTPIPSPLLLATAPTASVAPPAMSTDISHDQSSQAGSTGSSSTAAIVPTHLPDSGSPTFTPAPAIAEAIILSQTELSVMVAAAIGRWAAAGATPEQIAAMKAVSVSLANIAGFDVGDSTPGHIVVDNDGAGYGWFLDSTPGDDSEFTGTGTDLHAIAGGAADGKLDLMTVLMHELGHQVGLTDDYQAADSADLMYGYVNPGERRLPSSADVAAATGTAVDHESFALAPVAIGTVTGGTTVQVSFQSTVNTFAGGGLVPSFDNQATLNSTETGAVLSNHETLSAASTPALASLTIGDTVFIDANNNHTFDAGEGITGVVVSLFAKGTVAGANTGASDTDVDGDGIADKFLGSTTTIANGAYSFTNLAQGAYLVRVDAINFTAGHALAGDTVISGGTADPNNDLDNDNNAFASPGFTVGTGFAFSNAITLTFGGEPSSTVTAPVSTDHNINNTLDLGFTNNSPPTAVTEPLTAVEDTPTDYTAASLLTNDTDPDSDTLTVTSVGNAQHGTVTLSGTTITFTPAHDFNGTGASFDYTISDGHGHTSTVTDSVTVSAVNDAPVNSVPGTQSGTEDTPIVFNAANSNAISISDVDAGTGNVTVDLSVLHGVLTLSTESNLVVTDDGTGSVELTGKLADINAALNGLSYTPASNYNGADTLTVTSNDNGNTGSGVPLTDTDTVAINLAAVDDNPVLAVTGTSFTYTENDPSHPLFATLNVSDVDNANFNGGTLTIADASADPGDSLQLGGVPSISFNPATSEISYNTIVFGTVTITGNGYSIALNANATPAAVEALLTDLQYVNTSDDPVGGDHAITVTLTDGAGGTGSFVTHVNVVAVNDNPAIANLDGDAVTFVENDPVAYVDAGATHPNQLTVPGPGDGLISDPDSHDFGGGSLVVSISAGAVAGEDRITFVGFNAQTANAISFTGSNIFYGSVQFATSSGSGTTRTFTFNANATAQMVTALLHQVVYIDNSENPSTADRTIQYVLTDGDGGSTTAHSTIHVTSVNDAPVNHVPGAQSINEDAGLVFNAAHSNTISISDVDAAGGNETVDLTVLHGTLTLSTEAGLTVTGDGSGAVHLIGTIANINAALDGLTFAPNADYNGADTLTIATNDNGNTGGAPLTDTDTVAITVAAVNDTPVLSSSPPVTTDEQVAVTLDPALTVHDADLDAFNGGAGDYAGATLNVAINSGHPTTADDHFTIANGADFHVSGSQLLDAANHEFATFSGGNGTPLVITFTSAATPATTALVNEVAHALQYTDGSDAPPASVDVSISLNDGDFTSGNQGAEPTPNFIDSIGADVVTVNINAVNDPPAIDLDSNASGTSATLNYTENQAPTAIAPSALVTDPDSANFNTGTLTAQFTANGAAEDRLTIIDQGAGAANITVSGNTVSYGGAMIGTFTGGTDGSTPLVVTFNTSATLTAVQALAADIAYSDVSEDPSNLARTVSFTVTDDHGAASNVATATINVTPVADLTIANDDTATTDEAHTVNISVLANDTDPDSPVAGVAMIDGQAATVGVAIAIASGAHVTLNSDGTLTYDPSGKFNALTSTAGGETGAVNTSALDTFSYTNTDGNSANVNVTVNGLVSADDRLAGDSGNNVITGTPNGDFFFVNQGGNDDLKGLGGSDLFYFGNKMNSADKVDGGGGVDQIALQGDYSTVPLILGANVVSIESLAILPGSDTRFGDPGTNHYSYDITTNDANVAAGVQIVVDANRLRSGEDFTFNGSAETDGSFFIYGGNGVDHLTGGAQNDAFLFGSNFQWGASDQVNGGGGINQLALRGDYSGAHAIVFGATQLTNIQSMALISAHDTRFGALGAHYSYDLTMNDGNLAAGVQMTVDASTLRSDETLTFNGSVETNGTFRVFGGAGNDVITGGHGNDILVGALGADTLTGGGGNDTFLYRSVAESTPSGRDGIQDFSLGDIIDLSRIDGDANTPGQQSFHFLAGGVFTHHAGELIAAESAPGSGLWTVSGDVDGDGVADFQVIVVVPDHHNLTGADFHL
jgi:hypothetical protein